ncbi:hypothetical protein QAD02_017341 [Eretmocerus hayati]|uniref:Uncharacterized protein n=1 Tax=Eretmocerus hayati TaxID=131215 RepID=A0ACC2PD72_9HYME|nr:hypothetical protein QAD02_017341 [Eretmocerus hayati]
MRVDLHSDSAIDSQLNACNGTRTHWSDIIYLRIVSRLSRKTELTDCEVVQAVGHDASYEREKCLEVMGNACARSDSTSVVRLRIGAARLHKGRACASPLATDNEPDMSLSTAGDKSMRAVTLRRWSSAYCS